MNYTGSNNHKVQFTLGRFTPVMIKERKKVPPLFSDLPRGRGTNRDQHTMHENLLVQKIKSIY